MARTGPFFGEPEAVLRAARKSQTAGTVPLKGALVCRGGVADRADNTLDIFSESNFGLAAGKNPPVCLAHTGFFFCGIEFRLATKKDATEDRANNAPAVFVDEKSYNPAHDTTATSKAKGRAND